jgi:hypothetical protein
MRTIALVVVAAALATPVLAVQPAMKLYQDDFALVALERLNTSVVFTQAPLAELTTSGAASGTALEALATWDFTPGATRANGHPSYGQVVPATSAWTCYLPDTIGCGFGSPGVTLLAVGDGVDDALQPWRSVAAYEFDNANGRVLGRASVFDEGLDSEIRLCLPPGQGQPDFPIAVFSHVEGGTQRHYMQALDEWSSDVFDCVPAITQGGPCRSAGTHASVDASPPTTEGRQRFRVVKAGTITLPTGHVLDALLIESFTSYTAKLGCPGLTVLTLRQWRLTWAVPEYGPILSISSPQDTPALTSFTTASTASLGIGLLPPVAIQATSATQTSVTVSWTPGGLASSVADGWIVHWGPSSGTQGAPPNNSGPIPVGTTSYTIQGLAPGQTVFVSVTSRRAYTDPKSSVTTVYESIALPQRIGADLDGDGDLDTAYPPETQATTLVPGACVKGDIAPPTGDDRVSLSDYLAGRAKLTGRADITARDTTCGDAAPGSVTCAPAGQASHWCATGNGAFTLSDLLVIRRLATGAFINSCAACQVVLGGAHSGEELRLPGDIAPRGNADGAVTIGDVVVALRMTVSLETPTAEELLRADVAPTRAGGGGITEVVGNGSVTIGDVVTMLRASVQLETLRWPRRLVRAHVDDSVDFVGFKLTVGGWPTWAIAEPAGVAQVPCDDATVDVVGDQWVALCDTSPTTVIAPTDLFDYGYRSPEPVPAASLVVVPGVDATTVSRPATFDDFEPTITLSNVAP